MRKTPNTDDLTIMSPSALNEWYFVMVGYRPQEDMPEMTNEELRAQCVSYQDAMNEEQS